MCAQCTLVVYFNINTGGALGIELLQSTDEWACCDGAKVVVNDWLSFGANHAEHFAEGADGFVDPFEMIFS